MATCGMGAFGSKCEADCDEEDEDEKGHHQKDEFVDDEATTFDETREAAEAPAVCGIGGVGGARDGGGTRDTRTASIEAACAASEASSSSDEAGLVGVVGVESIGVKTGLGVMREEAAGELSAVAVVLGTWLTGGGEEDGVGVEGVVVPRDTEYVSSNTPSVAGSLKARTSELTSSRRRSG